MFHKMASFYQIVGMTKDTTSPPNRCTNNNTITDLLGRMKLPSGEGRNDFRRRIRGKGGMISGEV